jgi:DNA-binding SARP family transcriptional activator/predicted ATPase/Tfp pilus assembly protein PilF
MLQISLLGELIIRLPDKPITHFRSQKEIALLAYLAHTGQTHNREVLADLLWEARSTKQSLSNLRTALTRLRQQVGDHLVVTRKTVAVTPTVHEQTDSVRFQAMLAGAGKERSVTAVNLLAQGLALYSGEFMAGFSLPDTPRFNDWLVVEQERLRQISMRGYRQLTGWQEEQGAFSAGVVTAQQWVASDPLDETAQQQLMRLLAYDGRVSEALGVYEKCRHLLQIELGIPPAPATTALYEAIQKGSLPPPDITPTPLHNLPRALTPLFGRKKEIKELTSTLLNPEYPLISVTGVGGIGKTSLALAAGRQLATAAQLLAAEQHPFQDGIWFVSLEEIENDAPGKIRDKVAALVGQAMDLYFHGESDLWSQLLGQLASKHLLLILDNIEQFLTVASDLIVGLLEAGDNIHLLVTSRTTLPLAASVALPLTGLETPEQVSAEALQNESVRLFAERAARMPTPFQLEKHLAEVVAICQFVEGMPLAIELAAASLGRLMVAEILPALTNNLHLLDTMRRDLPPRQRTLQAVFDTTWQLLDPREQSLLAQISIFQGGFTRLAAEAVLNDTGSSLYNLQHHALLRRDETGRFKMHPLIRQFAVEQRSGLPNAASLFRDTHNRHSRYYLQMIGQQAPILQRGAPRQLLATLQIEQHNVRAAWQQAVDQAAWADIEQSLEGVQHFYYRSGLFRDGIELITQALETADATDLPPQLIPSLHQAKAALLQPISQFEATLAAIKDALSQETVSKQTQIRAYLVWGLVLDGKGDYQGSLVQYQTAGELLQDTDDWLLLARSRQGIGWALIQMGQTEAASEPLQQALEFSQRADDKFGQMMTLTFLGVQARRRNKLTVSERYYGQALDLARALGDRLVEGKLLANLGIAASMRFALSQAQRNLEQALTIFEQLNVPRNRAITGGDLGVIYARLGSYERAQHFLEQALALARQIEDRYGEVWGLNWLSGVVLARGDADAALQLGRTALSVADAIGIKSLRAGGLARMGDALLARGELAEAADCYHKAHTICEQLDQSAEATHMLAGLADIALRQQQPGRAMSYVETILTTIATDPEIIQGIHLHIYWVCYQVLQALEDPRAAATLAAGQALLLSRADNIDDKAARQLFLTQIVTHRQILEATTAISLTEVEKISSRSSL